MATRPSEKAAQLDQLRMAFVPESMELRAAGEKLDDSRRKALLKQIRSGDPVELELSAVVYRQSLTARPLPVANRREANANFATFPPDHLGALAASFRGRPFLRDHDTFTLLATGGVIAESEMVEASESNWLEIRQTLRLTAAWAVEAALDGTLRTFSIGWRPKQRGWDGLVASAHCTVCDGPMFSARCSHWPGDEVKLDDDGGRVIVELRWRNSIGAETSGVTFPAVEGTGIDDVRAALADYRHRLHGEKPMKTFLMKLLPLLGLSEDAGEEATLEAVRAKVGDAESLRSKLQNSETLLAAEQEKLAAAQTELGHARTRYNELVEERRKEKEDALVARALSEGRMRPGQTAIEKAIRALAATDLAAATEYVEGMARLDPIGTPPQADRKDRDKPAGDGAAAKLTAHQLKLCKQMGITPEQFLEHNQPDVDDDQGDDDFDDDAE